MKTPRIPHTPAGVEPAVVLIDCRVALFQILSLYPEAVEATGNSETELGRWFSANWAYLINRPRTWVEKDPDKGYVAVIVDDRRREDNKYWRSDYLPAYKTNRPTTRPPGYQLGLKRLSAYLEQPDCQIPLLFEVGFEADDLAGEAYRIVHNLHRQGNWNRELYLLTSDSDWQQLVCDEKRIFFSNALTFFPRLRGEREVIEHSFRKGYLIDHPTQLAEAKSRFGDPADNIPADSILGLTDLINPPVKPGKTTHENLLRLLQLPQSNTNLGHADAAQNWLITHKYPLVN